MTLLGTDDETTGHADISTVGITLTNTNGAMFVSGGWRGPSQVFYDIMRGTPTSPVQYEEDDIPAGYLDEDGERKRGYWVDGPGSEPVRWPAQNPITMEVTFNDINPEVLRIMTGYQYPPAEETLL